MAEGDETLELKFRIFDGTDIGRGTYPSSITTATLKQQLLSEWPQGCDSVSVPDCLTNLILINCGAHKVLFLLSQMSVKSSPLLHVIQLSVNGSSSFDPAKGLVTCFPYETYYTAAFLIVVEINQLYQNQRVI